MIELRRKFLAAIAASTLPPAWAQGSDATIKLIVPVAPGGSIDAIGRVLADALGARLKRTVIVENKAGAGGVIGSEFVSKAKPDGQTLLIGLAATHSVQPAIRPSTPYDPIKGFAPVAMIAQGALVVCTLAKSPVSSIAEIPAWQQQVKKPLTFGSGGQGTFGHLTGEILAARVGFKGLHVPYRGAAPAVHDLLSGLVDLVVVDAASVSPHVRSGLVKVLAAAGPERNPSFPSVRTLQEQGVVFFAGTWVAVFAPPGTPRSIVTPLAAELQSLVASESYAQKVAALGLTPSFKGPEDFLGYLSRDVEAWRKTVRSLNLKLD